MRECYKERRFVFGYTSKQNVLCSTAACKGGDTLSSRHVSSCDITRAVGMLWRGHTILTSRELMWCYACSLGCERRFNIEFYATDSHFFHAAYVTWSHVELWSAHTSHISVVAHISWDVTNVSSALKSTRRDVSRVTEVWICAIEFNVQSPLTSQTARVTSHELTWREDSVSPP